MIKSTSLPSPGAGKTEFSLSSCCGFCPAFEAMTQALWGPGDSFLGVRPSPVASLYRRAGRYITPRRYIAARDFSPFRGHEGLTCIARRAPINKPSWGSSYLFKEKT